MIRIILALLVAGATAAGATTVDYDELQQMIKQGQCEQASADLDAHLTGKSPDHRALFFKAQAELLLGNLEEAQDWGEKSVEAAPDSAEYWAQLGTIKAFRIRRSPMKGITLGRSSRKNYEKAVELDPRNLNALESLMMFRLYAPGIAGGDKDEARRLAEEIMAVNPAQGHLARAQILRVADQDLERARIEMRAAAEASPDDPAVCYELGRRLGREGLTEDSLEFYRLGAERDPDPTAGQLKLAAVLLRQGHSGEAQAIYEAVQTADPGNPTALTGQATVLLARGRGTEAAELLAGLVEARPDYPPARFYLAESYLATDTQPEDAVRLLNEYLGAKLNLNWPSRATAHWRLALALEKCRRFKEAWQAISLAMELSGSNDQMKNDAARLEFMGKD